MTWPRRSPQQGRTDHHRVHDAGAAVVEAALVAPLVIVVLLGVVESALAWRDHVALVDAAGEAARVASLHPSTIAGWAPVPTGFTGVAAVMAAVSDGLGTARRESLERIVVFTPTGPAGRAAIEQMPEQCRTSPTVSTSDRCVVLVGDDLTGLGTSPEAPCGGSCPWRQSAVGGERPSHVGVYVLMRRQWIVPGLGSAPVSEVAVVVPLEGGSHAGG